MEFTPMSPQCGVEVSGVSLAKCTDDEMDAIRKAIYEHGVAVFRDQEFSPEDHIKFGRRWGGIDVNNYFPLQEDFNEIAVVKKDPDQTVGQLVAAAGAEVASFVRFEVGEGIEVEKVDFADEVAAQLNG